MNKYKKEIDFLIKNEDFKKQNEKVSRQQLEKIKTFYQDVPIDFLDFLSEIGSGTFKKSQYEFKLRKLVLNENLDFFPMGRYLNDDLVSERLKQAMETMGITGFEFSELDYEVVIEE